MSTSRIANPRKCIICDKEIVCYYEKVGGSKCATTRVEGRRMIHTVVSDEGVFFGLDEKGMPRTSGGHWFCTEDWKELQEMIVAKKTKDLLSKKAKKK